MLLRYLLRRSVHAALLLLGVSAFSFALVALAPGDYFSAEQMNPQVSAGTVEGLRTQYGLDRPLPLRYANWLGSALTGDFGVSIAYHLPASQLLFPRVRNTLLLAATAVVLAWMLGVPLGLWAATAQRRWPDWAIGFAISLALAIPEILLCALALFLAVRTGAFPVGGMVSATGSAAEILHHMALPVVVLVAGLLPVVVRHTRAAVLDIRSAPFVSAARAHGLPETTLAWKYILRAAANPLVTLAGLSIGTLLSVSLLVEVIMGWPGLGPLLLDAVSARDVHVIIGSVVLSAALLIGGSLAADILLYACDPRIRVSA